MYITLCATDHQSRFKAGDGVLRVLRDNPEGWDGEEGGRRVQDGGHMYIHH